MEEFLGVLFCGGRGTRLGEITKFISKSFVPIYDKPVFKFGLNLLEKSSKVTEIIILTNDDNDAKLKSLGYSTIIQDDTKVFDMFSGWEFIKQETGSKKHGVLVPSDNISDVNINNMIESFQKFNVNLLFSLFNLKDKSKLSQMGVYDKKQKRFYYKHPDPPTKFGVIAPYIVNNKFKTTDEDNALNDTNVATFEHKGYWFDVGDFDSIIEATKFISKLRNK